MLNRTKKYGKVIGRKIEVLRDIVNAGGVEIKAGEICTITQSFRGYGIKTDDNRSITRVPESILQDVL